MKHCTSVALALAALIISPAVAASKPKTCKLSQARSANPYGSVLVEKPLAILQTPHAPGALATAREQQARHAPRPHYASC
jgi:hypothetical protein